MQTLQFSSQTQYTHLIIVCCHAIYLGGPSNGLSENEWVTEAFQQGETPTFIEHVKAGLQAAADDSASVLLFSGGATKRDRTGLAEGESYLNLARDNNYFSILPYIDHSRVTMEPHATDSYQNVLFSLLRFRLYTGFYPQRVTVVTHEFKRRRFMDCHFPAVGLASVPGHSQASRLKPEEEDDPRPRRVSVIGINPPEGVTPVESLTEGEEMNGIGLWKRDRYGMQAQLAGKRAKRGWQSGMEDGIFVNVGLEPVVEELVCWDGGHDRNGWFVKMDQLPWYCNRA